MQRLTDMIKWKFCAKCSRRDSIWMCRECLNYSCQHMCEKKISSRLATCADCIKKGL